jgi:hypothetical protein
MAPIAAGFQVLVTTAAMMAVIVGAIGGAVVWRMRINLLLGGFLTVCVYFLLEVAESH